MSAVCAATETPQEDALGGETHYVLRRGEPRIHPQPLPVETEVLVDHFKSDGSKTTTVGFRGWDFQGDGRFGLVEVLNADGTVQARLFDFDSDGRADLIRHSGEK